MGRIPYSPFAGLFLGRALRRLPAALLVVGVLLSWLGPAGCSRESLLYALAPGVLNDPSNKRLRFEILSYGLETFCKEARDRSNALRLGDRQPSIGRFMATSCHTRVDQASQTFTLTFAGHGWIWNQLTGRLTFQAGATVRYRPDFQRQGEGLWVYFQTDSVSDVSFSTTMVESAVAQAGMSLTGVRPDVLGRKVFQDQLSRGFTVIRYNKEGEVDFGMGLVPKGQRPWHPYDVRGSQLRTLENDRTLIHPRQQDYITGLVVSGEGRALTITLQLQGPSQTEAFLLPHGNAATMLTGYVAQPGPQQPTAMPLLTLTPSVAMTVKQKVRLPKGIYTLVLDHSAVGSVAPQAVPAQIDFLVQEGPAD